MSQDCLGHLIRSLGKKFRVIKEVEGGTQHIVQYLKASRTRLLRRAIPEI